MKPYNTIGLVLAAISTLFLIFMLGAGAAYWKSLPPHRMLFGFSWNLVAMLYLINLIAALLRKVRPWLLLLLFPVGSFPLLNFMLYTVTHLH